MFGGGNDSSLFAQEKKEATINIKNNLVIAFIRFLKKKRHSKTSCHVPNLIKIKDKSNHSNDFKISAGINGVYRKIVLAFRGRHPQRRISEIVLPRSIIFTQ